jgi:hypothetical protein
MTTEKITAPQEIQQIVSEVCELIKQGKSFRQIHKIKRDNGKFYPSPTIYYEWQNQYAGVVEQFARARKDSAEFWDDKATQETEYLAEKTRQYLDKGEDMPKGVAQAMQVVIQRYAKNAALRDDSRYADRKHIALGGEQDAPPVKMDLSGVSTENLRKIRELLTNGNSESN